MLPIQFILLLILASMPGELIEAAKGTPSEATTTAAPNSAATIFLVTSFFLSQLVVAMIVWYRAKIAIRTLHNSSAATSAIMLKMDTAYNRARWLTVTITAGFLFSSSLPQIILGGLSHTAWLGHIPITAELFFITPAIIAWLIIWTAAYFVESATRERGMPYRMAQALPVHEMPALTQYLSMQARHSFFPLLFLIVKSLIVLLGNILSHWLAFPDPIATSIGLIAFIIAAPALLVRIWSTRPLIGPLRERLEQIARMHRLRFRNILLWKTHNMVQNAAILGWVPWARYFLMTDSLMESFSDKQLEGVFAHEVGHGVHRHMPWYAATLLGAGLLGTGLAGIALSALGHAIPLGAGKIELLSQVVPMVLVLGCAGLALPLVASRFEHQADWFACRHMDRMAREQPEPPTVQFSSSTPLSTSIETVTLEQYIAGQYPHATSHLNTRQAPTIAAPQAGETSGLSIAAGQPLIPIPAISSPPPASGVQVMGLSSGNSGTEVFISALDAIVETSHRARDRRGWMHPSVNDRIALLRRLASSTTAAGDFERRMLRTRLLIVGLFVAGIVATAVAIKLPDPPLVHGQTTPASNVSPTNSSPDGH